MSEINGALGSGPAHFRGRAHVFLTCAPDVRTFFSLNFHSHFPGRIVPKCMQPRGAQNKRLISNTVTMYITFPLTGWRRCQRAGSTRRPRGPSVFRPVTVVWCPSSRVRRSSWPMTTRWCWRRSPSRVPR